MHESERAKALSYVAPPMNRLRGTAFRKESGFLGNMLCNLGLLGAEDWLPREETLSRQEGRLRRLCSLGGIGCTQRYSAGVYWPAGRGSN